MRALVEENERLKKELKALEDNLKVCSRGGGGGGRKPQFLTGSCRTSYLGMEYPPFQGRTTKYSHTFLYFIFFPVCSNCALRLPGEKHALDHAVYHVLYHPSTYGAATIVLLRIMGCNTHAAAEHTNLQLGGVST